MLSKRTVCLALAGALMSGAAAFTPAQAAELKAEVIHWWTSGGESAAVKVFADQFTKAGGTWIDTAIAGGANARTAAINRVVGGKPPTAMQFNTGKQFDDLVAGDLLRDMDALAKAQNWDKIVPKPILDAVTRNGHVYAVPVNIHAQNWLWYNKAVLEKAGAKEPKTIDELFATLDKIKATGVIPLAFASQKTWERGLFNSLLAAQSRDLFVNVYTKRDVALVKSPEFRKVAEAFGKMRDYTDPSSKGRNWNDATALVITGKAGMQFMGDWAKGEFNAAGQTVGKEYGCVVVGPSYVMGGDVFAFAKIKDADQTAAQDVLAKTLLDPETQIKFNAKKGSVPVRTDIDVSTLDACAQTGAKLLSDPKAQAPAVELMTPATVTGAVEDVISQYWNNPSMPVDDFLNKFAAALKSDI
ncbi:ABC transporter substrate-binding protein [Prosthecomicrobium sp. N25]|uniref:ABC transporter substrate-binding protein n=1 Tax=Prosthecomicrobium sp. N25 TaxID=3129254 RepID=UPI0030784484